MTKTTTTPPTKLSFNPDVYRDYVRDMGLTTSQEDELLRAVWSVVVGIIDLKCGMHFVDSSDSEATNPLAADSATVLALLSTSDTTNEEDAKVRNGPHARGTDS